jgi:hypothetical protein
MKWLTLLALAAGCSQQGILVEVEVERGCLPSSVTLTFVVTAMPAATAKSSAIAASTFFAGDHLLEVALPDGTTAVEIKATATDGGQTISLGDLQLPIDGAGRYSGILTFSACSGADGSMTHDLATLADLATLPDLATLGDFATLPDLGPTLDLTVGNLDLATSCETRGKCRVFVSSVSYTGDLGGLAGADANCQTLATGQNLVGSWKAWLSDSKQDAATRLHHSTVPYRLVDNTLIANDWAALTATNMVSLLHAIDHDEAMMPAPVNNICPGMGSAVWTNTTYAGALEFVNEGCSDFMLGNGSGQAGRTGAVDSGWTQGCGLSCNQMLPIYCFEQ